MKRRRFKQERALGERLIEEARRAREKAEQLPPSKERDALLKKAQEVDMTARIDQWLSSPGLKAPT